MDVRVRVAVLGVDLEDERQLLHRADLLALPSGWLNSAAERPKMPSPADCEQVQWMPSLTLSMSRMRTSNEYPTTPGVCSPHFLQTPFSTTP